MKKIRQIKPVKSLNSRIFHYSINTCRLHLGFKERNFKNIFNVTEHWCTFLTCGSHTHMRLLLARQHSRLLINQLLLFLIPVLVYVLRVQRGTWLLFSFCDVTDVNILLTPQGTCIKERDLSDNWKTINCFAIFHHLNGLIWIVSFYAASI